MEIKVLALSFLGAIIALIFAGIKAKIFYRLFF